MKELKKNFCYDGPQSTCLAFCTAPGLGPTACQRIHIMKQFVTFNR
jgi:hypothetical protein